MRRRIEEIKTGRVKRSRKSTAASKSAASQHPPRSEHLSTSSSSSKPTKPQPTLLPIPSPPPGTTLTTSEEKGGVSSTSLEKDEEESGGKATFTVKLGFTRTVKSKLMGEHMVTAVSRCVSSFFAQVHAVSTISNSDCRFNEITYHGTKLLSLCTLMLGKELPLFDRPDGKSLINQCFFAVSTAEENSRPEIFDDRVVKALEEYRKHVPEGYIWPTRAGLNQSLTFHTQTVMADIRRHIVVHLVKRITKYATVKLSHLLNATLPDDTTIETTVVKKLAQRLTKRLVYNEKQAYAIAKAKGEDPPPIPVWTPPTDVLGILNLSETSKNQDDQALLFLLSGQTQVGRVVREVFDSIVNRVGAGGLPICNSKAADKYNEKGKDNPWLKYYYPLHHFMLRQLEDLGGMAEEEGSQPRKANVIDKPVVSVHYAWARRKVVKICGRHPEVHVSRRSKRRATMALLKAINSRSSVRRNTKGAR